MGFEPIDRRDSCDEDAVRAAQINLYATGYPKPDRWIVRVFFRLRARLGR